MNRINPSVIAKIIAIIFHLLIIWSFANAQEISATGMVLVSIPNEEFSPSDLQPTWSAEIMRPGKSFDFGVGYMKMNGYGAYRAIFRGRANDWLYAGMETLIFDAGFEKNGLPKMFGANVFFQANVPVSQYWNIPIKLIGGFSTQYLWCGIGAGVSYRIE